MTTESSRRRLLAPGASLVAIALLLSTTAANAAPVNHPTALSGNEWACTHTSPPMMIHAGGAKVTTRPGTVKFTAHHVGADFNGVYDSVGYLDSLNSGWYCGGHRAFAPPKLGQLENPVVSAHYVTSGNFRGDAGFDIWLEPSAHYNTYYAMTHAGPGSTEAMIWISRPDWKSWAAVARARVTISGRTWYVVAGKVGHGRGWERVFFVAPNAHNGNVTVSGMRLDPFFSYLMKHRLLRPSDVLAAVDNGAELSAGSVFLAGYQITGLRGLR